MRRGRAVLFLVLILVLGLVAVVFYTTQLSPASPDEVAAVAPTPTPVPMVDVVAVAQRVGRGQALEPAVLQLVPYEKDKVKDGMVTSMGDIFNRRAKFDLEAGFILEDSMLTEASTISAGSDAAILIPKGMVAISIPISRLSSVSYGLQRGDHVNVIATLLLVQLDEEFQARLPNLNAPVLPPGNTVMMGPTDPNGQTANVSLSTDELLRVSTSQSMPGSGPSGRSRFDETLEQTFYVVPSEPQRPRLVSQSVIQDVIVLHVGNFQLPHEMEAARAAAQTTEVVDANGQVQAAATPAPAAPPPPDVITLIVSPQDAVTLNYLVYSGAQLTLAMRGVNDDSKAYIEAVTLPYLLEQYLIPIPIKLPYGMEPRLDALTAPALPNDVPTPTPAPTR